MHAQVENVLRISQLEKNQVDVSKEKQDLHDLVDEAISHVDLLVKSKDGYIKTHFNAESSLIMANHFHLTNVIVNMIDNAIKYRDPARGLEIHISGSNENGLSKYLVSDTGIGISEEHQGKIFEIFHRLESNEDGEGLGLTIVKRILNRLDGSIDIESETGIGTTFTVILPSNGTNATTTKASTVSHTAISR